MKPLILFLIALSLTACASRVLVKKNTCESTGVPNIENCEEYDD